MTRPGKTILIVDDESVILSVVTVMLQRAGYSAITAANAKEVFHLLEVWPEFKIDLVLLDVILPDMNGIELGRQLQVMRPNLPILYFSAYSGAEGLRPIELQGLPYISKPFTPQELRKRVREMLGDSQKRGASTG